MYVFVVAMAKTCPHCRNFKRNVWPELKVKLNQDPRISNIVEIEQDTMISPSPPLDKWVKWWPTLLLITKQSWDRKKDLEGFIFNGKMVDGEPMYIGGMELTVDGVMKWIDKVNSGVSVDVVKSRGSVVRYTYTKRKK
jgi:hypothetical protein